MSRRKSKKTPVVSLVSLGCAKNTVDSERILGEFVEDGWLIAADPADADICLVNTCGFIEDARSETEAVLNELRELRKTSGLQAVAALGCMVERAGEVEQEAAVLAAADMLIGFRDYPRLAELCRERIAAEKSIGAGGEYGDFVSRPRMQTGYAHHAYLKISEGCSNSCSFCTIPAIRGPQKSMPIDDLVREARSLIDMGAREIEIVAQDTTSYGKDLYGERCLPRLLNRLAEIETDCWFRLMYAYPPFLTDDLLEIIAGDERFCPYIDIPLQHISDPILKAMGRGMGRADTIALLDRIERIIPDVALRTTFIVGYPGETEKQFAELLEFVEEGRFAHAGVFTYSHEAGTRAGRGPEKLARQEKDLRRDILMAAQMEVSRRRLQSRVGRTLAMMLDQPVGPSPDHPIIGAGHSKWQEIDVDGSIFITAEHGHSLAAEPGDLLRVKVVDSSDYDLVAELAGDRAQTGGCM